MPDLSIRSAAQQLGISHTALRKRIGHGRVSWPPASLASLQAEWEANKDVAQQQRGTAAKTRVAPSAVRAELPPGIPTQAVSNAREAALKVEERALRVAQKKGMLIDANEARAAWAQRIVTAKNKLLVIGDELGEKLAAETDPIRCREMVTERIRAALKNIADAA